MVGCIADERVADLAEIPYASAGGAYFAFGYSAAGASQMLCTMARRTMASPPRISFARKCRRLFPANKRGTTGTPMSLNNTCKERLPNN